VLVLAGGEDDLNIRAQPLLSRVRGSCIRRPRIEAAGTASAPRPSIGPGTSHAWRALPGVELPWDRRCRRGQPIVFGAGGGFAGHGGLAPGRAAFGDGVDVEGDAVEGDAVEGDASAGVRSQAANATVPSTATLAWLAGLQRSSPLRCRPLHHLTLSQAELPQGHGSRPTRPTIRTHGKPRSPSKGGCAPASRR